MSEDEIMIVITFEKELTYYDNNAVESNEYQDAGD